MNESNIFQRRMLGILCALLAPCCVLFGLFGKDNLPYWFNSISATYFANDEILMIGLLFSTAVFFFSYAGYDWKDRVASIIQGITALGIIVFPCGEKPIAAVYSNIGLFNLPTATSNLIHSISAIILFVTFGLNIMFLFTKTSGVMTNKKKIRNTIYIVCACVIFLFSMFQVLASSVFSKFFIGIPTTMINEFMMLEAFSFAWLVKGETFKNLND